jgi:hypothetical protein
MRTLMSIAAGVLLLGRRRRRVRGRHVGRRAVGFMGRYEDEIVKIDGRWRIESRKLVSFVPSAIR